MAEDTDLAAYLQHQRKNGSQCFCEWAPPEIVKQVDAAILAGSRQWTAMVRWLGDNDVKTSKAKLADHHTNNHAVLGKHA